MLLAKLKQEAAKILKEIPQPNYRYGLSILLDPKINFDMKLDKDFNFILLGKTNTIEVRKFSEESLYKNYLTKLVNYSDDKFTSFHFANLDDGLFIKIKQNLIVPLEIIFDAAGKSQFNHVLLVAEKNVKANIIIKSLNGNYHSNIFEIFLKDGSGINLVHLCKENKINFTIKRVAQEAGSKINFYDIVTKNNYSRIETTSSLNSTGAESNITKLISGNGEDKVDVYTRAFHNAEDTKSNILTKSVARDNSRILTRGLVKIAKYAENSNGYQKSETLFLGENAEAYSIPNLEIENNNVKCTHGSSISQIDQDKVFYLMSRGLTQHEAEEQIINGFLNSILNKINFDVEF